jgi:hypothetical protein
MRQEDADSSGKKGEKDSRSHLAASLKRHEDTRITRSEAMAQG